MKKSTISLSFEEEKLSAVKRYMSKKNTSLEAELTAQLERLYSKFVPVSVQNYIADREADTNFAPSDGISKGQKKFGAELKSNDG